VTWREAYLRQARSDYEVYSFLNTPDVPLCHRLHYLQMASEKLAKSFLSKGSRKPYKKTHIAFVRFLKISKRYKPIQRELGYAKNLPAYCAYIDSLLGPAQLIEDLAPVGGDHDKVNPEYPWKDATGVIRVPVDYAFREFSAEDIANIQTLLTDLFRIAPAT